MGEARASKLKYFSIGKRSRAGNGSESRSSMNIESLLWNIFLFFRYDSPSIFSKGLFSKSSRMASSPSLLIRKSISGYSSMTSFGTEVAWIWDVF